MSAVVEPVPGLFAAAACAKRILAPQPQPLRRWAMPGVLPGIPVAVEHCADWIKLAAQLDNALGCAPAPRRLLEWNATLAGSTRFARDARGDLCLAAHLPVSEDGAEEAPLLEALAGFRTAMSLYTGIATPPQPVPMASDAPSGLPDVRALKLAIEAAGWPCSERHSNRLVVGLEGPAGRSQAVIFPTATGGIRFAVELCNMDSIPRRSQEAVAELLLRACHAVRYCRTSCLATDEGTLAVLEVLFGGSPSATALSAALESLSVGCSLCAAEINALTDETIAAAYLETGVGNPTNHNHRKDSSHGHVKNPEHHRQ